MVSDSSATIASTGKACINCFDQICQIIHDRGSEYGKDITPYAVADEFGRFKIWAGNIGALQPGNSSLDTRLRQASHVRRQVLRLLDDLNYTLREIYSIISGSRPQKQGSFEDFGFSEDDFSDYDDDLDTGLSDIQPSSDDDRSQPQAELRELFLTTAESITSLLKLSIVIRNPAPKDRYVKSAVVTPMDPTYDVGHVWQKYPQIRKFPWLIKRLGGAITRRREFFQYRERHRRKLSRGAKALDSDHGVEQDLEGSLAPTPTLARKPQENSHLTMLSTTAPTVSFPPTQASDPQGEDLTQVDETFDDRRSETSYATAIGEGDEHAPRPPPRPREAAEGKPFECPYCFVILVASSDKSWRRHIYNDLNPYICTFEDCDSRLYSTRHEWFEHELARHRMEWQCKVRGCRKIFKSVGLLEAHLRMYHVQEITEIQLPALLEMSEKPIDRISPDECPFCEQWSTHLQNIQPSIGPQQGHDSLVVTPNQFRNHVARHMEQLALFALPKRSGDEDDDDANSNKPAADDALEENAVENAVQRANFSLPEGIIKLPLERGANVKGSREDLPLYLAAKQGLENLQKAVEAGTDVSAVGPDGAGAIHQAARDGDFHATLLLLGVGADLSAKDSSGSTPLHRAAEKGHTQLVETFLDRGADIDSKDLSGATALRRAAGKGHKAVTQSLLASGANVNARDFRGSTALHRAAENGHENLVQLLCAHGAEIGAKDNDGLTPLFHAIQRERHEAVVLYLLSRGTDIETKNFKGVNALQTVAGKGHLDATQLLLNQGADVDAPGPRNMRSLHRAAYNDHAGVLEILLNHGANADLRDDDGWTALHGAASAGFVDSTRLLVERARHTLEARDNNGMTPLHHAAAQGRQTTITVLLENGANARAETNEKQTPSNLANSGVIRELFTSTG